ncbi:MAG: hypothetical protein ACLGG0_08950 [Bacteriovoracia bacterium]
MKIAYIIDISKDGKSIGVLKKIDAQISEWRRQGHDVQEIYTSDFYPSLEYNLRFFPKKFASFLKVYINSYALRQFLRNKTYDVVYARALIFSPFLRFLKAFNFIMELNANELDEYKKTTIPLYIYSLLTRKLAFSLPRGFVAVSNEINAYYSEFKKPSVVIANACPNLIVQRTHQQNKRPIIGFIGAKKYIWNGNEKVLKLAEQFPQYDFEIIGFDLDDCPPNVKTHGFLKEEDSIEIMKRWNAAISTLSLYEQGLTEASPLKSRLYLAMNIPFIYAYDDTDEPFSHCLKIPNSPNNVDSSLEKIADFFQTTFSHSSIQVNHQCHLNLKEKKRLDFMASTIAQKSSNPHKSKADYYAKEINSP